MPKALANSVLVTLAEFKQIVRLPGGKKKTLNFSCSFMPLLQEPSSPDSQERGANNETGDHFAEVAEPGRRRSLHPCFWEVFAQVNELISIATACSGDVSVFS